ncbi:efflux transporter outer membrane subunit [Aquiflexum sp. TKW24L]|uniref:efflux transporter outer membrane subunit n=1 Tax=Aquiflexum sp. TKW24L TaxID=2942212 RepID=UPI0020BEA4E4|nr:efflux transporter outer membrane subunit [Aquiflexum sp. TKW24L]MCL6258036.1 efflux transporter outer membrane subunit [Aquiflexum sp. TKW24L]
MNLFQPQNRLIEMKYIHYLVIVMLVFSGCAVGPRYSRPDIQQQETYIQSPIQTNEVTNLKWWEVYQDSLLQSLIQTAIDSNLDLMSAVYRVEEAKAVLGYNKANLYPFLDYSATGRASEFRNLSDQAGVTFSPNMVGLLGNVSWEIDLWGKLRHANRAAYAELMATEESRKSVYISLVAQVAELYFQLRGLDERLFISQRAYETRLEYLDIITARFEKGNVSELDKLQAEQIAASAKAQIYSLERDIIRTENAMNVLLGRTYLPINRGLENNQQQLPLEIPSGLPSELLERRPDIKLAEQQLIAQTERIGVAVALRFPSLSLTALFGVASPQISTLFGSQAFLGSISGQLAGPFFRFGQNKRRVEAERARATQLSFQYEKTILTAFAEVENSLAEIRTYSNEFGARQTQVYATEKSLMLSKALYDNGYTSFLQVLDAEREYFNSEYEKSLALQNQLISTVRLYKALGGGW